jgi:hypothetical protein
MGVVIAFLLAAFVIGWFIGRLRQRRREQGGEVASWHDALAADQLPREIVGNWCVAIEQMLWEQTYPYRRCKNSNWDIIVRWDGFDAQETSCELNTIKRQGAAWLASFGCSGAGLAPQAHVVATTANNRTLNTKC